MPQEATDFFKRLHTDEAFRRRFSTDPAAALREEGFDPDKLNLPSEIDPAQLERRLSAVFEQGEETEIPGPEHADLSADELWTRFNMISPQEGQPVPLVVAVVAYAGPPVVATVTVVGIGSGAAAADDDEGEQS
ncbi:MAG: NHLP-related RiPP peptide [Holophagales bacterium]|nr:NHLP-related RiPP peptide [Holophagales bacterium]